MTWMSNYITSFYMDMILLILATVSMLIYLIFVNKRGSQETTLIRPELRKDYIDYSKNKLHGKTVNMTDFYSVY